MKFTQRPLWALELLIAVLGLIGVGALAKHYIDRPALEIVPTHLAEPPLSVPDSGERQWIEHCQQGRASLSVAMMKEPDAALKAKARALERSCVDWQLARIETLLKLGEFDAAGQAWGALDRWQRQMLAADRTGPRLQQVSEWAHQQAAKTRDWIARYPGWVDQLAGQAQAWPVQPVPAASDASPDRVQLPTLTADLVLLIQAQSAWLHALRLPAAERAEFLGKQPGAERMRVVEGKLQAGEAQRPPLFEWPL